MVRCDCVPGTQFESSGDHIGFVTNHGLEFCDRVSPLHQRRHSHLDGGDGNCVSSRQIVTSDRHRPRDGAGRRDALQIFDIRSLRTSPAGSPFGDDFQGARNPPFLRRRQRSDPLRHPDAHSFAIDISAGDSIEISVILQREPRPLGRKRATCTTGTARGGGKLSRSGLFPPIALDLVLDGLPSLSELRPACSTAEMWTNTSLPPPPACGLNEPITLGRVEPFPGTCSHYSLRHWTAHDRDTVQARQASQLVLGLASSAPTARS